MTKFKVFEAGDARKLEDDMNAWAEQTQGKVKVKRTQLAAAYDDTGGFLAALISYEDVETKRRDDGP